MLLQVHLAPCTRPLNVRLVFTSLSCWRYSHHVNVLITEFDQ